MYRTSGGHLTLQLKALNIKYLNHKDGQRCRGYPQRIYTLIKLKAPPISNCGDFLNTRAPVGSIGN